MTGTSPLAGVWADKHFGTKPWCTLAGLFLGLGGAGLGGYQLMRPLMK